MCPAPGQPSDGTGPRAGGLTPSCGRCAILLSMLATDTAWNLGVPVVSRAPDVLPGPATLEDR